MPRKSRSKKDERCEYRLLIKSWSAYYTNSSCCEDLEEGFSVHLEVELLEPVKGITSGSITLYSDTEPRFGGVLNYDRDKRLQGGVWLKPEGVASLIGLLSAGHKIRMDLIGKLFHYRSASIRDVTWFIEGYPDIDD